MAPQFPETRKRPRTLRWLTRDRAGQAVLEHVVTAGILLVVVVMLALFLYVFKEYGGRILDLVASDYP